MGVRGERPTPIFGIFLKYYIVNLKKLGECKR
jgi:hypothetical protein